MTIEIPTQSTHVALVGTHGIKLVNRERKRNQVELGFENDHHFLIQVWTKKSFLEEGKHLYDGALEHDFVLVYYYGKKYTIYDLRKSVIEKFKAMFEIGPRIMPFFIYFKFATEYFVNKL